MDCKIKKKADLWALLPIVVFLVLYLGNGIYFEYINPIKGQMGFYVVSVVLAFSVALAVAFAQNKKYTFEEKIHICALGIADDNIVTMLFIFILAGAFSGIASGAGGATSTANMLLNIIPHNFEVPGLFLIACLISMAMGTSVGSITVLVPIAVGIASNGSLSLPLCVGAVVGGSMFGDNLSFISDTTIAATKTQGVAMKDKFRTNIKISLPAAVITFIILVAYSLMNKSSLIGTFNFNIWQALPYFVVLLLSVVGMNVFLVLSIGIVLFGFIGVLTGKLSYVTSLSSIGNGISGMFETMIVTILVASVTALIRNNGGFQAILELIKKRAKSKTGGMFGITFLTAFMDIATANNTVAIVVAAPIAKEIGDEYGVESPKVASLLDVSSCIMQGIIPYGAQLLVASSIAKVSSFRFVPYLIYPFVLAFFVMISIITDGKKEQNYITNVDKTSLLKASLNDTKVNETSITE